MEFTSTFAHGQGHNIPPIKKRRTPRACDACRRRKAKCHGGGYLGMPCANCAAFGDPCTYGESSKRRGPQKKRTPDPSKTPPTTEALLARIQELEGLLKESNPGISLTSVTSQTMASLTSHPAQSSHIPENTAAEPYLDPYTSDPSSDEDPVEPLSEWIRKIQLNPLHPRQVVGAWSGRKFVESVRELKQQVSGSSEEVIRRRPEKWSVPPWEKQVVSNNDQKNYSFPDDDLLPTLVDNYFKFHNDYMPLLHRPSFEEDVHNGLHFSDNSFAALLLCVCAIGSWYCDDPRVLATFDAPQSAGWKWFNQVDITHRSPYVSPRLYDIQTYCLSLGLLHASSTPNYVWMTVGIALRLALDIGVHRKKVYGSKPTPHDEQWKRAFWSLVIINDVVTSSTGRPSSLNDDDLDADLPIEVDDEYWVQTPDHPAFRQPENKPSKVSFFVQLLRLHEIESYALRTLFPAKRSHFGPKTGGLAWEQQIVAEIDSHLNEWMERLPPYLQWEKASHAENPLLFQQAGLLRCAYHLVQITVHRTYISSRRMSSMSFPSLAICTNSARTIASITDAQLKSGNYPFTYMHKAAFAAGAVLVLRIWGQKLSGIRIDYAKEMEDIDKCLDVLKHSEKIFPLSGRRWDILHSLASGAESIESPARTTVENNSGRPSTTRSPENAGDGLARPLDLPSGGNSAAFTDLPQNQLPVGLDNQAAQSGHLAPPEILHPSFALPHTDTSTSVAGILGSFLAPGDGFLTSINSSAEIGFSEGVNHLVNNNQQLFSTQAHDPPMWQGVFTGSELDIWSSLFGEFGGNFPMVNPDPDPSQLYNGGPSTHFDASQYHGDV